ncbi:hypothetical protein DRQ25_15320 [Candidatus Fermentibacteria bacterium]|nr:MAG: hypothetical protein DRQ25_15320 [Candidatus Fermentibacteria bacterium]
MATNKITQIYTLIDDASATLDEIARGYMEVDTAIDKNAEANKRATSSAKQANAEGRKTVETLKAVKQARVIEDKQLASADRAYKRLIARYDATERVTQRVAAAEKILSEARRRNIITAKQYTEQLRRVTMGIEDQVLATRRSAMAQLSLSKIWERAKFILKTFIAAMAIRAIYAFTTGIVDAALAVDKMEATLKASTGSLLQAKMGLEFVKETANSLGLVYKELAVQYSKFIASTQNTTLEAKSEDIFAGFSKAAVALRLSSSETEGIFRALVQMVSKGTVQAEELRGQLGERLPGALRIAADALGVTTQRLGKMLEQGQVVAEDLLPAMAAALEKIYGEEALKAADSMLGSINSLKNAWFDFLSVLANGSAGNAIQGIFDTGTFLLNGLTATIMLAGIAIDNFQVHMLGFVRLYDDLDKISLGVAVAELGRVDQALRGLQRQMEDTSDMDRHQIQVVRDLILEYSGYRVELEQTARAMAGLSGRTVDQALAFTKAKTALQGLRDELNPLFKATQAYQMSLAVLNDAVEKGVITSTEEFGELLTQLVDRYNKAAASALGYTKINAAASKARRDALSAERKELKEFEKAWDAIIKQEDAQEKSDLGLQTQLKINQAWKDGARDLTELTNKMALMETERAASVTARKNGLEPGQREFTTYVSSEVGGERLKQENKHLAEQRKSLDELATDAEKYKIALEEIYRLHAEGSPAAVEATKQLNLEYVHLLSTTEQFKLAAMEGFEQVRDSAADIFTEMNDIIVGTFQGAEDAVVKFAKTGKLEFADLVDDIIEGLLRIAIQKLVVEQIAGGLASAFGGFFGGATSAAVGTASSSGGQGVGSMFPSSTYAGPFASGGTFKVPGSGSGDNQLVTLRATPGERVTVDPVGAGSGTRSSGNLDVQIVNNGAPADAEVESGRRPDGSQFLKVILSAVAQDISSNGVIGRTIDGSRGTRQRSAVR